jgi:hypothetical protein
MNTAFNTFVSEINSSKVINIEPFELKRKLDKTSRVKPSILHYSHLNLLMAYAESHTEAKFILTLEFDKSIKYFLTQPATFTIEVDGKMVPHTPDVVVIYHDGTVEFIQIKPEKKAKDKEYLRRFNQIVRFFKKELGVDYTLRTEASFGEGKYIENLQQLYLYLDIKLTSHITNKIITELPSNLTISALEQLCIKHNETDIYAWALIAQDYFSYDCKKILTKQSNITPNH